MSAYTPTETLVLEVLIARHRLGESLWTFERTAAAFKAAKSLEGRGLVALMHGMVERTFRATLTDLGKAECMNRPYKAPMLKPLRTLIDGTEWDVTSWRDNWRAASKALHAVRHPQGQEEEHE